MSRIAFAARIGGLASAGAVWLSCLLGLQAATASPAPDPAAAAGDRAGSDLPRCASAAATIERPCTLPLRVSPAAAEALLERADHAWWLIGDRLTLIARPSEDSLGILCCTVQAHVEPLPGSELVGVSVRIPRVDEALLDVAFPSRRSPLPPQVIRGARAPSAPARAQPLRGEVRIEGLDSAVLGETRGLVIYAPLHLDAPDGGFPVIYLADGTTADFAPILEAGMEAGQVRPAIIVGLMAAPGRAEGCRPDVACTRRNLEYLPHASAQGSGRDSPFGRFLRFVTDEVVPFVGTSLPASASRDARIVAGASSGATWAFAALARRPDVFGGALLMSPTAHEGELGVDALAGARVYAGAGTFEPHYLRATRNLVAIARNAGAQTRAREIVSGHSLTMWELLFSDGASWLLPESRRGGAAGLRHPSGVVVDGGTGTALPRPRADRIAARHE